MHPSPHPSQVRSACERCRRQKLRCLRQADAPASCSRCSRLGLICESGSQRRVGRPPKRDLVLRTPSVVDGPDTGPGKGPLEESGSSSSQQGTPLPADSLLDQDVDSPFDWTMECASPLIFGGADMMLPLNPFPILKDIQHRSCCPPQELTLPANVHFETLSRLNVDIHKGYDSMARISAKMSFEDFICYDNGIGNGWTNLQMVMKCAQEFLVVIKTLHRQMGVRNIPKRSHNSAPLDALSLTMDPFLTSEPPDETMDPGPETLPAHDSPTIFLVISCYVQLIKHLELIFNLIHTRITECPNLCPAPMAFADVTIIEASPQFILFCELVSHILAQTNLVLGLPSTWSGRSAWTGLLRKPRYREMVNAELGGEEDGGWTGRPGKLMERTRVTKELLIEYSMIGG